jgi:hypothetical protein
MEMVAGGLSSPRAPRSSAVDLFHGSVVTRIDARIRIRKAMSPKRCFLVIDICVKIEFLVL